MSHVSYWGTKFQISFDSSWNTYLFIRCIGSSFKLWCLLVSLSSSSSCLPLLPCLPIPSIFPYIFYSATCFRRQFLGKMWPIQSAFLLFTLLRKLLSFSAPFNTSSLSHDSSKGSSPAQRLKIFGVYLICFLECPSFSPCKAMLQIYHFTSFFLKFEYNLPVKKKTSSFWMLLLPWQA